MEEQKNPATRLLEKRRKMYEEQANFEKIKKKSKQTAYEFKETEADLRKKDIQVQESMIQFSVFLQGNEQKKNQARERIQKEEEQLKQKEIEYKNNKTKL